MVLVRRERWRVWTLTSGKDRVLMKCPSCAVELGLDHRVEEDGRVVPSVVCPHCSFHDMVALEMWDRGVHEGHQSDGS